MIGFIKAFIKRLRCKHDYEYDYAERKVFHEGDFSGDGCYNTWTETYDVYKCKHCGKRKRILKD